MKKTRTALCVILAFAIVITTVCLSSCEQVLDALISATEEYVASVGAESEQAELSADQPGPVTAEEPSWEDEDSEYDAESEEISEELDDSEDDESLEWNDSEDDESFEWEDDSGEEDESSFPEPEPEPDPEPEPAIPFAAAPEIPEYVMPAETFADSLEKEAADIIDGAICRAIAVVSVYKDERHSKASYAFDYDANGFVKELSNKQKALYERLIGYAESFKTFEYTQDEYGGDLITDALTVAKPLSLTRPDIDSYFTFSPAGGFSSIIDSYFDPYKDSNSSVKNGKAKMEDIKHGAKLLQRIIERVVRKMPADLTTYDKYLYLATVVSAQNSYDSSDANCFTPFGALVCGKSVCEGYSRAFLLLCREADLWCAYRFGIPKGGGHIWNMIKLDTGIYNVDITWSDNYETGSKNWFYYFVKPDASFAADGHNANEGVKGTGTFEPNPFEKSK